MNISEHFQYFGGDVSFTQRARKYFPLQGFWVLVEEKGSLCTADLWSQKTLGGGGLLRVWTIVKDLKYNFKRRANTKTRHLPYSYTAGFSVGPGFPATPET